MRPKSPGPAHAAPCLRPARRADEPESKAILDNVVLMLWPTINPDGQQMVAEWYMKNVGTPYEQSDLPVLYQDYVGHDNNRDAYMLNMIESRVIEHAWRQWEPQIVYVHHQSGPFPTRIWLPPFSEPVGTDAPYLMAREVNMIGMAIAKGLEEHGQVGATHMGTAFDAWYPGYIDYAPNFKNIAAFWTETALYQYATPHDTRSRTFHRTCAICGRAASIRARGRRDGGGCATRSTTWKRRHWSVLEYAAKYKESLLLNRYRAGRDQIARGLKNAPYAYVIPQDQRDVVAAVELLRRLAFGGVRVSQLTAPATIDGVTYPDGHLGDPDRSGIRRDGARSARRAEVSRPAAIPGRSARAPVRRRRLDAAAPDGRPRHFRCVSPQRRRAFEDQGDRSTDRSETSASSVPERAARRGAF